MLYGRRRIRFWRGAGPRFDADVTTEPLGEGWLEAVAGALEHVEVLGVADGVAQFTVSSSPAGSASFNVVVADGYLSVSAGRHPEPDVVLGWSYADFAAVWRGDLSPEAAYMSGRMKLEGDQVLLIDGWRQLRSSPQLRAAVVSLR